MTSTGYGYVINRHIPRPPRGESLEQDATALGYSNEDLENYNKNHDSTTRHQNTNCLPAPPLTPHETRSHCGGAQTDTHHFRAPGSGLFWSVPTSLRPQTMALERSLLFERDTTTHAVDRVLRETDRA